MYTFCVFQSLSNDVLRSFILTFLLVQVTAKSCIGYAGTHTHSRRFVRFKNSNFFLFFYLASGLQLCHSLPSSKKQQDNKKGKRKEAKTKIKVEFCFFICYISGRRGGGGAS